jgi:hypothetical protein
MAIEPQTDRQIDRYTVRGNKYYIIHNMIFNLKVILNNTYY